MAFEAYNKTLELGQDLFDLCIQEYGNVQSMMMLLNDNLSVDIDDFLEPGTVLVFRRNPPDEIVDTEVMNFMRRNELRINNNDVRPPATGWWATMTGQYFEDETGTGWWGLGG